MKYEHFTLEEIEYLLIVNKCEYLYGFKDSFIKYDKSIVKNIFDKIADGLEEHNLISRSFKGDITYDDDLKEAIDTIINVETYYDVTIIDLNKVSKKYRIYELSKKYVVIEVLANDKGILDFNDLTMHLYDYNDFKKAILKLIDKNFKFSENNKNELEINIDAELYKKITKMSEEEFLSKVSGTNDEERIIFEDLYTVVNRNDKVISVAITHMKKRTSKVYMYINGAKKVFKLMFKINGEKHKWTAKELYKEMIDDEVEKVIGK